MSFTGGGGGGGLLGGGPPEPWPDRRRRWFAEECAEHGPRAPLLRTNLFTLFAADGMSWRAFEATAAASNAVPRPAATVAAVTAALAECRRDGVLCAATFPAGAANKSPAGADATVAAATRPPLLWAFRFFCGDGGGDPESGGSNAEGSADSGADSAGPDGTFFILKLEIAFVPPAQSTLRTRKCVCVGG